MPSDKHPVEEEWEREAELRALRNVYKAAVSANLAMAQDLHFKQAFEILNTAITQNSEIIVLRMEKSRERKK